MRLFLDANAGEPLRPEARDAVLAALALSGNPASVHAEGRAARKLLEDARDAVARFVGAEAAGVVFTAGATEANAMALSGLGRAPGRRLLVSTAEHDSLDAPDAHRLPVSRAGLLDLDALEAALAQGPALVATHLAQNETGVVQPIAAIAALAHRHGALLHVDAAQAPGRIGCDIAALGADSLTLSSHKAGGPKGAGALVLARSVDLPPASHGGGQERRRRPGTEALPAIAGFAAALAACTLDDARGKIRDAIAAGTRRQGAIIVGEGAPRLPNTLCLALPGAAAETQVAALDIAGIAVSAGSACSSGKVGASRALSAMGLGALAGQAIRVSVAWNTPAEAATQFLAAWQAMAERLLRRAA